jgi:predicted permease
MKHVGWRRIFRFPWPTPQRDVDTELAFHFAERIEELIASGLTEGQARQRALDEFGDQESVRKTLMEIDERAARRFGRALWRERFSQDITYAWRGIRRSPGFTATVVLTLALGVGATTAIYSVIDATLLHPLPYQKPSELMYVEDDLPGVGAQDVGISIPERRDLESSGIFESVSLAGHGANVNLTGAAQPLRLSFKAVTPNYFAVLGVDARLGHTFDPRDATPGYNLQAVISDGLWRREFGSDPRIVGKVINLDNDPYRVIGVMPSGFRDQGATSDEQGVELWLGAGYVGLPFPNPDRGIRLRRAVIARLKSGLSIAVAQERLSVLVASLKKQYPANYPTQAAWSVRLIPLSDRVVSGVRQSLILMFGAVGLVLLISCVNVANLLLARAKARGREISVRLALGASRPRIMQQLLTEVLLMYLLGGMAGFAILFCAQSFLLRFVPANLPHINDIAVGWGVLGFAVAVSLAAGAIFGLAPAWLMSRADLIGTLRQDSRGSSGSRERSRVRQILVISELALSLVLMITACLLLRSFWDLYKVQPGFNPDRVIAIRSWLPGPNDPAADLYGTANQESRLLREILRRSRSLPGVEEAAVGDAAALPLGHSKGDVQSLVLIREGVGTEAGEAPVIGGSIVSPEYFHLMGVPLLHGRVVNDQDLESTPQIAVINQAAVRAYWPGQNPVGSRVRLSPASDGNSRGTVSPGWTTIIGVVGDARTESLANAATPRIYRSAYQHPFKGLTIFLRGQLDPRAIPAQVREQVQIIDRTLPVFQAQTLDDIVSGSLSIRRFSMELVAFFAATALLLAGLGIYGTISFMVTEQRREFAIRLALGGQRREILTMVLRQGLRLAAVGAVLGVAGALVVSRVMAGLLYGVSPTDLPIFAGVTLALTGVALAASYIPALRATRLDPITILRSE